MWSIIFNPTNKWISRLSFFNLILYSNNRSIIFFSIIIRFHLQWIFSMTSLIHPQRIVYPGSNKELFHKNLLYIWSSFTWESDFLLRLLICITIECSHEVLWTAVQYQRIYDVIQTYVFRFFLSLSLALLHLLLDDLTFTLSKKNSCLNATLMTTTTTYYNFNFFVLSFFLSALFLLRLLMLLLQLLSVFLNNSTRKRKKNHLAFWRWVLRTHIKRTNRVDDEGRQRQARIFFHRNHFFCRNRKREQDIQYFFFPYLFTWVEMNFTVPLFCHW